MKRSGCWLAAGGAILAAMVEVLPIPAVPRWLAIMLMPAVGIIATTTAALIAAGIAASASAGSAYMSSRSSNRATDAQRRANYEALQFEREQEASRKAEYDRLTALKQQRYDAWEAQRRALLRRYGVNLPEPTPRTSPTSSSAPTFGAINPSAQTQRRAATGAPGAPPPGIPAPGGSPALPGSMPEQPSGALTLGRILGGVPDVPNQPPAPGGTQTLGELASWTDWRKYGVS